MLSFFGDLVIFLGEIIAIILLFLLLLFILFGIIPAMMRPTLPKENINEQVRRSREGR